MSAEKGMTPEKIMALINEGKVRRETPVEVKVAEEPTPPPVVEVPPIPDEPPAEVPNHLDANSGLPRRRRVGLRSDPAWVQKTLYLRRSTVAEASRAAEAMGVEFSELVEYSLGLQVQDETRSPNLTAILNSLKK